MVYITFCYIVTALSHISVGKKPFQLNIDRIMLILLLKKNVWIRGWNLSQIQWTWVWMDSGSWWWTGQPGVLWFMGSQRVRHDWATELNWGHYPYFKRWQEYTEEVYKKDHNDPDNHNSRFTHLEPDILECAVKCTLGSITMNKTSGGDGIPVELFQILKDDAVKVLYSICHQIWKTHSTVATGLE